MTALANENDPYIDNPELYKNIRIDPSFSSIMYAKEKHYLFTDLIDKMHLIDYADKVTIKIYEKEESVTGKVFLVKDNRENKSKKYILKQIRCLKSELDNKFREVSNDFTLFNNAPELKKNYFCCCVEWPMTKNSANYSIIEAIYEYAGKNIYTQSLKKFNGKDIYEWAKKSARALSIISKEWVLCNIEPKHIIANNDEIRFINLKRIQKICKDISKGTVSEPFGIGKETIKLTPYMAPEYHKSEYTIQYKNTKTDVFAWGMSFFHILKEKEWDKLSDRLLWSMDCIPHEYEEFLKENFETFDIPDLDTNEQQTLVNAIRLAICGYCNYRPEFDTLAQSLENYTPIQYNEKGIVEVKSENKCFKYTIITASISIIVGLVIFVLVYFLRKPGTENPTPGYWEPLWTRTFNETSLSRDWNVESGLPNNMLLRDGSKMGNNIKVQNGKLALTSDILPDGTWTSARVTSKGKFGITSGKLEIKMKIPTGYDMACVLSLDLEDSYFPGCITYFNTMVSAARTSYFFSLIEYGIQGVKYDPSKDLGKIYQQIGTKSYIFEVVIMEDRVESYFNGNLYFKKNSTDIPSGVPSWIFGKREAYLDIGVYFGKVDYMAGTYNISTKKIHKEFNDVPGVLEVEYITAYKWTPSNRNSTSLTNK